jgi:hypothetical protein
MPVIAVKSGVEKEFSCAAWEMMPSGKNGYTIVSSDCSSNSQNYNRAPYSFGASANSVNIGVLSVNINAVANGLSVNAPSGSVIITLALASGSAAGAMSASDFTKLAASTDANTASTIVKRDSSGNFKASTPVNANDVAIKSYVDSAAAGLSVKGAARAATTANITLSGAQTIDGVSIIAGDRVLVKNQSSGVNNGIYVCASGSWTRATDLATGSNAASAYVFVQSGTANANSGWLCTNVVGSAVVDTASLVFTQFSSAGSVTAGDGMTQSGSTLNVVAANSSIVVNADDISVAGYTFVSGATVARKYSTIVSIGGGSGVTVTHNLGTVAVLVQVRNYSTLAEVECDITTTTNTVVVTALGSSFNAYIVVIG